MDRSPGSTGSRRSGWQARGPLAGRGLGRGREAVDPPAVEPERAPDAPSRGSGAAAGADRSGLDAGPHTLTPTWNARAALPSSTIWNILSRAGVITPQPRKRPPPHLHPVRGRPAERVLAVRLHPLAPGRRHRRRDPDLARRPLPLRHQLHRPCPGHRRHRRGHLPDRDRQPRRARIHVDRQRPGVHHPIPARPQRVRTRTRHPRHRPEERPAQPPPDPGQSGAVPADPEEMAARPATRPDPARTAGPARPSSSTTTTTPGRTDPWATAPPPTSTPPAPRPPPPAATATGASATTKSPAAASPCATADACTTSASATNTTATPYAS